MAATLPVPGQVLAATAENCTLLVVQGAATFRLAPAFKQAAQAARFAQPIQLAQSSRVTLVPDDNRHERRTALVIGNGNYPDAKLRNPVPDARLVARTLSDLNFEVTLAVSPL